MPARKRAAAKAETPEDNAARASRNEARSARVRARFRTGVSAAGRSYRAGEVVEVDQAVADAWVAAGWAAVE